MSVRYSFEGVIDHAAIGLGGSLEDVGTAEDQFQRALNEGFVILSMAVAMGEITTTNWQEFYARATLLQKLVGAIMVSPDGSEYHLTPQDVHNRIGFKVNVSTEPKHTWANRKIKRHLQDWQVQAIEAVAVSQ